MKDPIQDLAAVVAPALQKDSGLTPAEVACLASSLPSVVSAQASVAVSVQASQAIMGK